MFLCCLMKSTATRGFVRSSCSSSSMGFTVASSPIIRYKHTVRVILLDDLTGGQGYAGEVHTVKAGYARNFLIPTKKALYATPTNIQRVLGVVDPLGVDKAVQQQQQQLKSTSHAAKDEDQHVKAADLLRYYLRNKILKIWRNVDTASTTTMASSSASSSSTSNNIMLYLTTYPGMVDAKAVQSKLSKQLKIDLDPNCDEEYIEISSTPVSHDLLDGTTTQGQDMMNQLLISMFPNHHQQPRTHEKKKDDISSSTTTTTTTTESQEDDNNISNQKKIQSQVQIRHLGEYLAKIHLKGNQYVGLRFSILKR